MRRGHVAGDDSVGESAANEDDFGVVVDGLRPLSLRHFKEDVNEIKRGNECGLLLDGFEEFEPGDFVEAYRMDFVKRKL